VLLATCAVMHGCVTREAAFLGDFFLIPAFRCNVIRSGVMYTPWSALYVPRRHLICLVSSSQKTAN